VPRALHIQAIGQKIKVIKNGQKADFSQTFAPLNQHLPDIFAGIERPYSGNKFRVRQVLPQFRMPKLPWMESG
jgi:hypothetical protein